MARVRILRWTEMLLWWSGALLLGWCAATLAESRIYQIFAGRSLDRMRESRSAERSGGSAALPQAVGVAGNTAAQPAGALEPREPVPAPGSLLGRLAAPESASP